MKPQIRHLEFMKKTRTEQAAFESNLIRSLALSPDNMSFFAFLDIPRRQRRYFDQELRKIDPAISKEEAKKVLSIHTLSTLADLMRKGKLSIASEEQEETIKNVFMLMENWERGTAMWGVKALAGLTKICESIEKDETRKIHTEGKRPLSERGDAEDCGVKNIFFEQCLSNVLYPDKGMQDIFITNIREKSLPFIRNVITTRIAPLLPKRDVNRMARLYTFMTVLSLIGRKKMPLPEGNVHEGLADVMYQIFSREKKAAK